MTLRDQIEARTNAANTSKTVRETDADIIHYKHETPTARDCSALHVSDEKRKGGLLLVTDD